ncbi:hypothetical protein C882_0317 [Caenispirillum salinarum AK4]|uniref:YjiS-like domain-containing protein n=1 Tax=Caenispirillum salinarum AK4 TaxID=1238182 RepID=K9GU33_9PROT|nr:DUF1127 domain-containing protein [Caenispirillum salinarum]EKV29495.1 hypothetical protein C882_0317 [Caenispirillum salinarum AK4]
MEKTLNAVVDGSTLERQVSTVLRAVAQTFARAAHRLAERRRIAREIAELHAMTDRDLKDIGIERCDIGAVARGAFEPFESRRNRTRLSGG